MRRRREKQEVSLISVCRVEAKIDNQFIVLVVMVVVVIAGPAGVAAENLMNLSPDSTNNEDRECTK